jgi:DNA-binding transcriptional ArsR family regulator
VDAPLSPPSDEPIPAEAAAHLLRALANPHRVAIVTELAVGDRCVHELVAALHLPQPLVSQHLRVLREERVVEGRRRGREVAYVLTDRHVAHIVGDAVAHVAERIDPGRPDRACR